MSGRKKSGKNRKWADYAFSEQACPDLPPMVTGNVGERKKDIESWRVAELEGKEVRWYTNVSVCEWGMSLGVLMCIWWLCTGVRVSVASECAFVFWYCWCVGLWAFLCVCVHLCVCICVCAFEWGCVCVGAYVWVRVCGCVSVCIQPCAQTLGEQKMILQWFSFNVITDYLVIVDHPSSNESWWKKIFFI